MTGELDLKLCIFKQTVLSQRRGLTKLCDSAGFEQGIQMTIEHGRAVFREKWGHRDCDIYAVGLRADDAWRVEHDWD